MGSTLPTGTVEAVAVQAPSTTTDITTWQTALAAACATSGQVEVKYAGADYLIIGPRAGIGLCPTYRWLFTFGAAVTINNAQRAVGNANVIPTNNVVFVGFSKDASTVADLGLINPWTGAANPFGAAAFSGFVAASKIATTACTGIYLQSVSGEAIQVWFYQAIPFGGYYGATLAQPDDTLATLIGGQRRIHALIGTQGSRGLQSAMISTTIDWPAYRNAFNDTFACFEDPVDATWKLLDRAALSVASATSSARYLHSDGSGVEWPVGLCRQSDTVPKGWLRNVRLCPDGLFRAAANDGAGTPIGVKLAYSTGASGQAYAFRSGTP